MGGAPHNGTQLEASRNGQLLWKPAARKNEKEPQKLDVPRSTEGPFMEMEIMRGPSEENEIGWTGDGK